MGRNKFSGAIYFIIGSLLLVAGIIMLVFDITKVGNHYLTQQQSAVGGFFVIFISIIILVIGYFCLSPFSKLREFFEGTGKRKR